jgi:hypothetical protein
METGAGEAMSAAIYRLLLRLYPREFRQRWEEAMVDTFTLQLADGWLDAWWCALAELLPAAREGLAIPIVSLAGSGTVFFSLMWALENSTVLNSLCRHLFAKLGG